MDNINIMSLYQINGSLSDSQKRFWFLQHIQPDCFGYNISSILKITGLLNIKLLKESLNRVIECHNILQASFPFYDDKPILIINHHFNHLLEIHELEHIPKNMRHSEAMRLMAKAIRIPFDLKHGPLIRQILYKLGNESYYLFIVLHQIICDTYSTSLFFKELIDIYQMISTDSSQSQVVSSDVYSYSSILPPIIAQNQVHAHLSYWEEQLFNLPILELPIDFSRPPIQTYNGSNQELVLPPNLIHALEQLSLRAGVDLQLILLGTLQCLLHRYTQKLDFPCGFAIPGRTSADSARHIGCLENILVLRTKLSETASFLKLLADLQITYKDAMAHLEVPFASIVQALQVDHDLTRTPLFQVLFRYIATPAVKVTLQDLLFEDLESDVGLAPYDLTLKIMHRDDSIRCIFNFNVDLFTPASISRLIGHFQTLLNGIIANPDDPISVLPFLTAEERQHMLVEWNATATPYLKDQCLHELFETQASLAPQALSLDFLGQHLTYHQLDAAANQLARYLMHLGVGPETPIGIHLEPSIEMMTGLLGILKAGGCYVPLDLEYPWERIAFILEDTQTQVLLTRQGLLRNLPGLKNPAVLLDKDQERIARESIERPMVKITSNSPACIFYTSGSTGRPKGVLVPHYAINRLVCNTNYVHFLPSDRVAQSSNVSFDGATFEIWGALLNGGCLVGVPKEKLLSPFDLAHFLREEEINVLFLTPAVFHQCVREVPDAFQTIRDLLMGGEVLEPRWVKEAMRHGPPARLLNAYGPTECTTFATWYEVTGPPPENRSIPIGRPISNTTIYMLDQNLQPLPIGITGELYIGGDGLALGYLRRPEETAAKFILNPFNSDPGSRLYKTGDLARFLPDGNVEFLGRIDHQIKIRGFRIEPGEIEEALGKYPGVKEALVVPREAEPGYKRLLAYIVTSERSSLTTEALRNFLLDLLPHYMIPTFFVFLDRFPLTPNGKIDRQALPEPDLSELLSSSGYVGFRDQVEKQLTEVWEKMLGVHPISVLDNFFSLGGHSLLGARMFIHLEEMFGMKVPLYVLYQRPTIAQLAEVFRNRRLLDNVSYSILEPINPAGENIPFFMVSMRRSVPTLKRVLGSEQPFYNLKSPLELTDMNFNGKNLEDIAGHYLESIRQVQPRGPYFIGGYCSGGKMALALANKIQEQGEEVALLFLLDPTPPTIKNYSVTRLYYSTLYRTFIDLPFIEKLYFLKNGIVKRITRTIFEFFYRNSINIPQSISKYIADQVAYRSILSIIFDYDPGIITNRTLLILSNQDTPELKYNWLDNLRGQAEVLAYKIPHGQVLFSPHFEMWVRHLRKRLEEIHAEIRQEQ